MNSTLAVTPADVHVMCMWIVYMAYYGKRDAARGFPPHVQCVSDFVVVNYIQMWKYFPHLKLHHMVVLQEKSDYDYHIGRNIDGN